MKEVKTIKKRFRSAGTFLCIVAFLMLFGCQKKLPSVIEPPPSPDSAIIELYQGPLDHLSAVRYGGCPMHPSCSEYALTAIQKHGALIGWIMTFDRLMRCGMDETRLSPEIWVDGHWRFVDTLAQNDFWWYAGEESMPPTGIRTSSESPEWGISIE